MSLDELLLHALNGLSFGALLFVLASGFTLVFGLMQIVNLAHGAFYLVGGYVGVAAFTATGSFPAAVVAGAATAAVIGLASERVLLRRVRGQELPEVLVTVGIALVIADACLAVFGGNPRSLPLPPLLAGSLELGGITYPVYRLFVLVLAVALGAVLYVIQHRTRVGALIRAGVDDREIAESLGINVPRVFTAMFVFGAALAGLAGVVAAGLLTLRPGADTDILLFALVVVVVGGLGSLQGAAVGSALIGLVDAFSKVWVPELSSFAVFAPMAIVLMFRPAGLFGRSRT
jgi:branched-chain amino acid transport system permease protein